ncbi:MAG TPA: enoyl-CoA hydratase-related protein, partial [Thermodesulfobacteriota bacterium]|nr:enoyl-CoA hydratase-related protein [Thermodesulfobacteriota bacterium]
GAQEALEIGLVNRVVMRDKLFQTAEEMAEKIASHNPLAVKYAKQAVVRGLELSLADGLRLEKMLASHLAAQADKKD